MMDYTQFLDSLPQPARVLVGVGVFVLFLFAPALWLRTSDSFRRMVEMVVLGGVALAAWANGVELVAYWALGIVVLDALMLAKPKQSAK